MADSNGRKHQRRPSFDPGVYMLQSEGMPESTSAFRRQLYEHRHRLYRTYEAVVPKSGPVSDEDDQACFLDFIDTVCIDLRISYGVGMYFLHLFICNAMWRRVFYCPPPALDDLVHMHQLEMDAAAMDWWGSSLLSFLLPWKWLWPWPRFSCSTRPFMFVDFSDQIQLAYYLTAFVSYHIYPALDAWLVTFGTHLINGMLCMCFWFGDPTRTAVWMLSGKGPTPTGHYKSWNSLWVPLLMWWMYLLGRRNIMSILSWQQLERLEMQKREHSELDAELAKDKNSANRARDRWHLWFNKCVTNLEIWVYFIWTMGSPWITPILWRCLLWTTPIETPDLSYHTPWILTLIVSILSTFGLRIWLSFLSFQIQCVVWKIPYISGFVINQFEKSVGIGIIY